jgi:hypothetical protein
MYTKCTNSKYKSFSLFLLAIIQALGYTSTNARLFTVPPNAVVFCSVLLMALFSDRFKMRGHFMLGGCLLGIIGYAMPLGAQSASIRYVVTFFVAVGVYLGSPMVSICSSLLNASFEIEANI